MNRKKTLFFLSLTLIIILGFSTITAADDNTTTAEGSDIEDNYHDQEGHVEIADNIKSNDEKQIKKKQNRIYKR